MRWMVCSYLALIGCYHAPTEAACTISCVAACPDGLECVSGMCAPIGGGCTDGGMSIDASPDSSLGEVCAGTDVFRAQLCFTGPFEDLDLDEGTIDTDNDCDVTRPQAAGQPDLCILRGRKVNIDDDRVVTVTGSRVLVLWAETTIEVDSGAELLVNSTQGRAGPAAGDPSCSQVLTGGTGGSAGSGGAGATFHGRGGNGGSAVGGTNAVADISAAPLTYLRGGCGGGTGGGAAGNAGVGGGAVYLVSANTIKIDGTINASGGNGTVASATAGGGGGGSGGAIVFDAIGGTTVTASGQVFALGGGGSSGGSTVSGGVGMEAQSPSMFATGGSKTGTGFGGNGSNPDLGGSGQDSPASGGGGGGGGGGSGFVRAFGPQEIPVTTVAPAIN
ncbi:MAG: hypothetical protein ABI867_03435 [Kofleriaceae bacterium]